MRNSQINKISVVKTKAFMLYNTISFYVCFCVFLYFKNLAHNIIIPHLVCK